MREDELIKGKRANSYSCGTWSEFNAYVAVITRAKIFGDGEWKPTLLRLQLCRLIGHAQRFHHFADVAVHKVFDAVQCQPYTVVGNASLGEVVRAYTLATFARAYLTFARGGIFGVGGGLVVIVQLAA